MKYCNNTASVLNAHRPTFKCVFPTNLLLSFVSTSQCFQCICMIICVRNVRKNTLKYHTSTTTSRQDELILYCVITVSYL